MRRSIRSILLVTLCGGMVFQVGCLGALAPLAIQLGASILFNNILEAIMGPRT